MQHQSKHLSDTQIQAAIVAVFSAGTRLNGRTVREELRRRHGVPGGVDHVYNVLNRYQPMMDLPQVDVLKSTIKKLQQTAASLESKLEGMTERAKLSEHREETHQAKYMQRIDSLAQTLRTNVDKQMELDKAYATILELHRKLHSLQHPTLID